MPKKLEWEYRPNFVLSIAAPPYYIGINWPDGLFFTKLCDERIGHDFATLEEAKQFCQRHADAQVPSEDAKLLRVREKVESMRSDYRYDNDHNIPAYDNGRMKGGTNAIYRFIAIIDAELKGDGL